MTEDDHIQLFDRLPKQISEGGKMSISNELFMHREAAKVLKSILDNGDFVVETFNESVLASYMEALGYPIKIHKSLRNIAEDFKQHCEERESPTA